MAPVACGHQRRRDALQRLAVKRRATMIIPIVFLLVPPLLLLVGAPLYAELFAACHDPPTLQRS